MRSVRGFALISALLLLLVITLLGVSLFLGVGLQQRAAGNSLDKSRALELAESTSSAAENWLGSFTKTPIPEDCRNTSAGGQFRVCMAPPPVPDNPPWNGATSLALSQVRVSTSGGINTYAGNPQVWITYLGRATMGPGTLYRIDAFAYGGSAHTMAVVESVYYVGGSLRNTTPSQSLGQ